MRGGRSLEQASGRGHRGLFGGLPGPEVWVPSTPSPFHGPAGSPPGPGRGTNLRDPQASTTARACVLVGPTCPAFPSSRASPGADAPRQMRGGSSSPAPWRPLPAHTQRAPCIPAAARNVFLIPCRPCRNSCKKCSESRSRPPPPPSLPGPFRLLWF